MTPADRSRSAQARVMADPMRLSLLALVMSSSAGELRLDELAGPDQRAKVLAHLETMVGVGLLISSGGTFRPSHDALTRFGFLLSERSDRAADHGDHERLLDAVSQRLAIIHRGALAPETVRAFVHETYDLLASRATVRRHLPELTARFASERLSALADLQERAPDDVLFVCVRNAGRSQIAAALMRSMAGGEVRVHSAGTAPASRLDPVVRRELERRGIDVVWEFPRPLTDEIVRASGLVVTMGCGDACPVIPGRRYVDWPVRDPAGQRPAVVREVVSDIERRVEALLAETRLRVARPSPGPGAG